MKRCTGCFYGKRTTIATWEPMWTCLHPKVLDAHPLGRASICTDVRSEKSVCGPEAALWRPLDSQPEPLYRFRN